MQYRSNHCLATSDVECITIIVRCEGSVNFSDKIFMGTQFRGFTKFFKGFISSTQYIILLSKNSSDDCVA